MIDSPPKSFPDRENAVESSPPQLEPSPPFLGAEKIHDDSLLRD